MTTLKIIPDFENKTAECIGCPSAGEHVDVRIAGAASLLPSSTLRFRVKFGRVTLALFPRPEVNETWETEGADLKCHLNLNTIQARRVCRTGNTMCHAILDQLGDDEHTVEPTLFFDDLFDVTPWNREPGGDEPYDLDIYPNQIADLNQRVNEVGTKIAEVTNAAQTAAVSATAAYESAQSAVSAAQDANARANAAESAARSASEDARRAEQELERIDAQVEEAREAATQASESAGTASTSASAAEAKATAAAESAAEAAESAESAADAVAQHAERDDNPHGVTKSQVGLGSVDNTSDMNKPVSHAQRLALELKQDCLSAAQIVAINSGIDHQKVAQIALNLSAISEEIVRATNAEAVLRGAIAAIGVMDVVLADELPAAGEQYQRKLYLIPSTNPEMRNVKDEFICVKVDNVWGWEQVGSTAITIEYDDEPTEGSRKAARSGGIWSWIKGLLPSWLTPSREEPPTQAQVSAKRGMTDRVWPMTMKPECLPISGGSYDWSSHSFERVGESIYLCDKNGERGAQLNDDGSIYSFDPQIRFAGQHPSDLQSLYVANPADTLALTSEVPALSAPSTSASATGKAADAKATGDALAAKLPTSAKLSDLRDEAGKPTSINRLKLLADGKLMSETTVQTGWGTITLDHLSDDFVAYDSNAMPYASLPPIGEWKGPFGEEWGSSYRFYVPASDSDPTSDDEATLGKWCIFTQWAGWSLMYSQSAYAAIPSIEAAEFTNASAGSPAPYAICGHAYFTRDPIAETRTREFAETTQAVLSVPLTNGAETMAQIKARLDAINADGKHVLFDVASIVTTPQLYLCTIFIDTTANILRIADQVTGKMYIGNYVATDTLSGVLSRAVDAYVRISVAATTKDINPSTGTTYPVVGQTVYLHEGGDATGPVRETATYDGSPVSFMVPKGFRYHVSLSNSLQGHFNPHAVPAGTESGTANANIDIAFEYDDFSTVDTFAGIQAALLNFDKDDPESINAARSALVGRVIEDTWVDLDVSNANGDATPARDAAGHPVWRDPTVVIDVRVVEDADGNTHLGAVMMRQYATRYQIPFDNPNKELAEEDNALDGVYYYGFAPDYDPDKTYAKNACVRQGSTIYAALAAIATPEAWTVEHWKVVTEPQDGNSTELLTLTVGDPIPYASYSRIYRNSLRDTTKNIVVYGHNRYEVSAYRQYLNSDANKNEWWEQKHIGQTKPSAASSYHGYLAGCSAAILAAAKAVKHVCSANTMTDGGGSYEVCDRFYLPSVREFFGTSNTAENDTPYNYWRALLDDPDAEPNNNDGTDPVGPINSMRKMKAIHSKTGSAVGCRLRSAGTGYSYNVWIVTTSGTLNVNTASFAYAASPACVIY